MAKRILITAVCFAVLLGAGYVCLQIVERNACISEEKASIPDLAGVKVDIVYTNCDILAKDEALSIYFSRPGKRDLLFGRWRNRRALVFRYDPGKPDSTLPSITHPSRSTIQISLPEVSSVIYQSRSWEDISIAYEIGKVDYPIVSK